MADLDSFFAKKDKKKVKGKKFTTTDEIARRLEETEKKLQEQSIKVKPEPARKVEESEEQPNSTEPVKPIRKEEEEWNDFKDDEKDMTDLKISKLQIEEEEDCGGSGDEDGEQGEGGDKKDGVWKTEPQAAPQQHHHHHHAPQPEPEERSRLGAGGSSYVPPHLRHMASSPMPKNTSRRSKVAPDINNEMAFPSLSDAQTVNAMGAWGKQKGNEGYESVKHGSRSVINREEQAPKLSTANRFDALSDHS